jgi:hypothetical protein
MAEGDRIFKVVLEVHDGVLEEHVELKEDNGSGGTVTKPQKKLHKRETKKKFRDLMKDPSKFAASELADSNHPTVIMREGKNDTVTFFHFEGFTIFFQPHPDIIEENAAAPDGPLKNSMGNVVTSEAAVDTGIAGPERFKAGPYKPASDSDEQLFWKFVVVTASGRLLDPCIITE